MTFFIPNPTLQLNILNIPSKEHAIQIVQFIFEVGKLKWITGDTGVDIIADDPIAVHISPEGDYSLKPENRVWYSTPYHMLGDAGRRHEGISMEAQEFMDKYIKYDANGMFSLNI